MTPQPDRALAEARFRSIFGHRAAIAAYARRRGSSDADAVAAETLTIAWRRLADVPADDPLPWLYATARNLVFAELRRERKRTQLRQPDDVVAAPEVAQLDPELAAALAALPALEREALLLVAWEDLTPSQAARSLGINPGAFRVRLLRARRRLRAALAAGFDRNDGASPGLVPVDVEET